MHSSFRTIPLLAGLLLSACDAPPEPELQAFEAVESSEGRSGLLPGGVIPLIRSCNLAYTPPSALAPIDPVGLLGSESSECTAGTNASPCAPHLVYTPAPAVELEPLFVFLPGTNMEPDKHTQVLLTAASTGYRSIGLSYDNTTNPIDACGTQLDCADECLGELREEVARGVDVSNEVEVDRGDAVLLRLYRILEHLDTTDPTGGWSNYYIPATGNINGSNILWENIILGGFSQGAATAAFISHAKELQGLFLLDGGTLELCFDGTEFVPATWLTTGADASAARPKYGVMHDQGFGLTTTPQSWDALGLGTALYDLDCAAPGCDVQDTLIPSPASKTTHSAPAGCDEHNSMAKDGCLPTDFLGSAAAATPPDARLFQAYARRMCYACDAATCP